MARDKRIATPTGNGTFRAGNGMFRSEVPQSMRMAVKSVVKQMEGKVAMAEHSRGKKR